MLNNKSDDDDDELRIKDKKDAFIFEMISDEAKDDKVVVKQEFGKSEFKTDFKQEFCSTMSIPPPSSSSSSTPLVASSSASAPSSLVGMPPSSSPNPLAGMSPFSVPTSSLGSYPFSSASGRPPSRPSSTDLQGGGVSSVLIRGIKRPSDEAHDGNPAKQVTLNFGLVSGGV